jgi:hypothetical protein
VSPLVLAVIAPDGRGKSARIEIEAGGRNVGRFTTDR